MLFCPGHGERGREGFLTRRRDEKCSSKFYRGCGGATYRFLFFFLGRIGGCSEGPRVYWRETQFERRKKRGCGLLLSNPCRNSYERKGIMGRGQGRKSRNRSLFGEEQRRKGNASGTSYGRTEEKHLPLGFQGRKW